MMHDPEPTATGKASRRRTKWLRNPLRSKTYPVPTERGVSRETSANWFSQLYYIWINHLMLVGYNRPLELNDIPRLPETRRVEAITEKISRELQRRAARGDKHALIGAINNVFFWEFWLGGLSILAANMNMVLSPLVLKYMIRYASDAYYGQGAPIGKGVGLVLGMVAMQVIGTAAVNQGFYRAMMVGAMARSSLISMIYAKSQTISARARVGGAEEVDEDDDDDKVNNTGDVKTKRRARKAKDDNSEPGWSIGKVSNLMSSDTYHIDQSCRLFHILWTIPVQIVVLLVQLLINIGPSALVGFGTLVGVTPALYFAVKAMARRRGKANKVTDRRIGLTQEILQAVRFVKYFAWEESFLDELRALRKKEINSIQFLLGIRSALNAVAMALPILACVFAFMCYALTHKGFSPAEVFSSFALMNALKTPLNLLPLVLGQAIDAWISFDRIEEYLLAEDENEQREVDLDCEHAFQIVGASFTWETATVPQKSADLNKHSPSPPTHEQTVTESHNEEAVEKSPKPFSIDNLSLTISRNELLAIVGTVGSGKTSLLAALAGEMRMTSGMLRQGSAMAYCPQYSWIQNATVRDNIVFGRSFDKSWYDRVVDACALRPDFDMLPDGDMTEVGERGITLSGGQKQRLGIARAVYFNADIVLLDDPLSAVDAHVGRHIFQEAIKGLLDGKCRVLATHQMHVLSQCDRILWLQDGKIEAVGTYENLVATHAGFMEMVSRSADSKDEKEDTSEIDLEGHEQDEIDDAIDEKEGDEIDTLKKVVSQRSAKSHKTTRQDPSKLMTSEEKAENGISLRVYWEYIKASGSVLVAPLVLITCCLAQIANLVGTVWLSYWTSGRYNLSTGVYIGVYAAMGAAQTFFLFIFGFSLTIGGTEASKRLLHRAMQRVLGAPMSFFDTTPLGRIINRFSKDVDTMDSFLTEYMRQFLITAAVVLGIFILIIVYYPWFACAFVPLCVLVYLAASFYRASSSGLKRHESVLRSTVFSCFGEALSGNAAIKAYGVQELYRHKLDAALDNMNSAYFLTFPCQTWLSTRLDLIGCVLALVIGLLVVSNRLDVNPSTAALVLSYILQVIGQVQFMVRQLGDMEGAMNSTERVLYYGSDQMPSEEERAVVVRTRKGKSPIAQKPPAGWPAFGGILFRDAQMRYREGLPLVLKGLDLDIKPGERIGIVGRTGAGKSSITSCLFRLVELDGGRIEIDGVDIADLNLKDLRRAMTIIPQDPTLFQGTIRSNLDPFGEHTDLELWSALRKAHLIPSPNDTSSGAITDEKIASPYSALDDQTITSEQPTSNPVSHDADAQDVPAQSTIPKITLDSTVEEQGLNYSLGQRQLMALARALVSQTRILICDEATSSIDEATDRKVQDTLQTAFPGCTVLCIAHRLRTIVKYDRVLVMDQGKVAEFERPLTLWENQGSIFRGICDRSKIRREDFI